MTDEPIVGRLADGTLVRLEPVAGAFADIYRTNAWAGAESLSGPGSGDAATASMRAAVSALVVELGVRSVLDAACGDGYWMPELPGYLGVDIAAQAIARAQARHPARLYAVGDVRVLALPRFDLVIVRDAIQHLSLADGLAVLAAVRATGSGWLLASTYDGGKNVDIAAGDCYAPDLEAPPFALGPPARTIFDGYHYHPTDEVRDPRKHLGLWRLGAEPPSPSE